MFYLLLYYSHIHSKKENITTQNITTQTLEQTRIPDSGTRAPPNESIESNAVATSCVMTQVPPLLPRAAAPPCVQE